VPEEGISCALIRAVCTDLLGPAENPDLLEGAEVAEGSQGIRVEAGEWPKRAYPVPS
jgi:hypothetical protein